MSTIIMVITWYLVGVYTSDAAKPAISAALQKYVEPLWMKLMKASSKKFTDSVKSMIVKLLK